MKVVDPSNITSITDKAKQAIETQKQEGVAGLPPELLKQLSATYIKKITPKEEPKLEQLIRLALFKIDNKDRLFTQDEILVEVWKQSEHVMKRDACRSAIRGLTRRGLLKKGEGKNSGWRVVPEESANNE